MKILILSDGRAGHDRSSLGVLTALARHRDVEASVLPIRETRRSSRRVKRVLAGMLPFGAFWSSFYGAGEVESHLGRLPVLRSIPDASCDLVISTGPRTAPANIAIARKLKARNVYYGSSRWPSDGSFTLLLTSERGRPHPHVAYVLRPSEIDAAGLPDARPLVADDGERRASLLFGGPLKHNPYTTADMEILAAGLIALTRDAPWLKWTVFDSRRTPKADFDLLVERVRAADAPVEFVRFTDQGLLSNQVAFTSDVALVTADSLSMLSECVAARRPTGILASDSYDPPARDAVEQGALISDRRAFPVAFSGVTLDALVKGAAGLEMLPGSQLDMLYEMLARHGI